jgi:hypothetical protein
MNKEVAVLPTIKIDCKEVIVIVINRGCIPNNIIRNLRAAAVRRVSVSSAGILRLKRKIIEEVVRNY